MIMIVMMKITRIMIILRKITQVEVQKGSYVEVMMILLRIMRRILKRCIESIWKKGGIIGLKWRNKWYLRIMIEIFRTYNYGLLNNVK